MENKTKNTLCLQLCDTEIKVFRPGGTPRIRKKGTSERDPDILRGIHTHFTYEIFFVTRGTLTLVTEDSSQVYERAVVIIPPRIKHYTLPDCEGSFCLLFSSDTPIEVLHGITELKITEDIIFYITRLTEKSELHTVSAERDAELLTALIFNALSALLSPDSHDMAATARESSHIGAIEGYINANLNTKLTLSDVAKNVYLSTRQVARIIEREYGTSFVELVTDKRLAKALMLIKNTDMKISDIAAETFSGSENYFYTLFKKKYDVTPLSYRKKGTDRT